jgi:nucleoside phosphorylase
MQSQTAPSQADQSPRALIVTALPVEFRAVCEHLEGISESVHPEGTIYNRGLFSSAGVRWEVFVVEGGMNNSRAALETERAIREINPQMALFVGVAGGLKDVVLGDVVAGWKIYNYEAGKETEEFLPRPDVGGSSYRLEQRARAEARTGTWVHRIQGGHPARKPEAKLGAIAAGEKVLASTRGTVFQRLRKHYGDALAVEMEGSGFLVAARANSRVDALVIRGISDLIEEKSQSDAQGWQDVAARHASAFAFEILAKSGPPQNTQPKKTSPLGVVLTSSLLVLGMGSVGSWLYTSSKPSSRNISPSVILQTGSKEISPRPPHEVSPPPPRAKPSLTGPVRTVAQLRTLTAVSTSQAASAASMLKHLAPGSIAFIEPWNISSSAVPLSQKNPQKTFEVHRLKTGQFILVGAIALSESAALNADTRRLHLQADTDADAVRVIGIPFELIRSTQVQRSPQGALDLQVELADP